MEEFYRDDLRAGYEKQCAIVRRLPMRDWEQIVGSEKFIDTRTIIECDEEYVDFLVDALNKGDL